MAVGLLGVTALIMGLVVPGKYLWGLSGNKCNTRQTRENKKGSAATYT